MRATTSIRFIAGSKKRDKNRQKNRPQSMSETQAQSPKVCFLPDSPLVYGKRRDSRLVFIIRSPPRMQGPPDAGCLRANERIVWIARLPYCCWWGRAFGRPTQLKEIGMAATGFERPARALFAAVSLAAMIAAFAIGQARAQTVNPVPPPPPPAFNPSTPNTVPQAPYVPVSPTAPIWPVGRRAGAGFACHRAAAGSACNRAAAGSARNRAAACRHSSNGQCARGGKARSIAKAWRPSRRGSPPLPQAPRPIPCRARARPVLLSGLGRILSALCQSLPSQPRVVRLLRGIVELLRLFLVSAGGG